MEEQRAEVTVLPVGDGEVRVGINMGMTRDYGRNVWLKPGVYLEVAKPDDIPLEDYVEQMKLYVTALFRDVEDEHLRLAGISRPGKSKLQKAMDSLAAKRSTEEVMDDLTEGARELKSVLDNPYD